MIAYSWTCLRDVESVLNLHYGFCGCATHYMFVEEREYDDFCKAVTKHNAFIHFQDARKFVIKRRNGGDNGFGKDGALAKRDCIEQVLKLAQPGDTLLECDSDVRFLTDCIKLFKCKPNRYKAFLTEGKEHKFPYFTGCIKSYDYSLGKKLVQGNSWQFIEELLGQCYTPSEDAFLSYAFHRLGGKFVDMSEVLELGVQLKDYNSKIHDIMS